MIIDVSIWDNFVGALSWDENKNIAVFQYSPKFINKGLEIAPILMPLREEPYELPTLDLATFKGLPPMLADSLPDTFGDCIMKAWLARQGKSIENLTPLERLGYIGKRGMGALEFEPVLYGKEVNVNNINLPELVQILHQIFETKDNKNYKNLEESALVKLFRTGTSAGGARAKAILAFDEENKVYKPGDILHGPNHSYWLVKLDGITNNVLGEPQGSGKIEYAYYKMAINAGINMSECNLIYEGKRAHFITKRFDRLNGEKLHMQTLAGVAGFDYRKPNMYSYEQVFTVLRKMNLLQADVVQQFRRMVFNVVARNQDDHVKNISFLMDKNGNWALSPAYDVSYNYTPNGVWTGKHQLSINGKRDNFQVEDLLKIGEENNISRRKEIIEQVVETVSNWEKFAADAKVLPQQIKMIKSTHRMLKNK